MDRKYAEIIGIGSAVYDTLMVTDSYPEEDTKLQGLETRIQGGGPCATALVAARKLGISVSYRGAVGGDPFGDFLLDDLKHWDVDARDVKVRKDAVSFHSVVLLNKTAGTRTCVWNRGTAEPLRAEEVNEEALSHARVLHLDGHMPDAALYGARFCREHGIKVSLDADGINDSIRNLLPYTDWLITSERFAVGYTGEKDTEKAARKVMEALHPEILVVTCGSRGGILMDEKGLRTYACYPVEVLDSNGCGDTFHGAFIAGKIRGMDNEAACRYASAAAAIKCTRLGARYAMADDAECRAFLKARGETV